MKRLIFFICFALLLTMTAGVDINLSEYKKETKTEALSVDDKLRKLEDITMQKLMDLPEAPEYKRDIKITPLCEPSFRYGKKVTAPSFADNEFKEVKLSSSAKYYADIRYDVTDQNGATSTPVSGVLLYDNSKNCAYMNLSGKVVTDFSYTLSFDSEYPVISAFGQYVIVQKKDKKTKEIRLGLLDIETGRESIETVYDSLEIYGGYCIAKKDSKYEILDLNGQSVFDFGETAPYIGDLTSTDNNLNSRFLVDTFNHVLYENIEEKPLSIFFYGHGYMIYKDEFYNRYLLDKDLNIIYKSRDALTAGKITSEYVIFYSEQHIIFYSEGQKPVAIVIDDLYIGYKIEDISFEEDKITAVFCSESIDTNRQKVTLDLLGKITEQEDLWDSENISRFIKREKDKYFIVGDDGSKKAGLVGVPFENEFFIVDYRKNGEEEYAVAVYDKQGKEILKGYEFIYNAYQNDRIVVYTDEYKCKIILKDFTTKDINGTSTIYPIKQYEIKEDL